MKILLIDNYDSFTYNLVHILDELEVEVVRSDKIFSRDIIKKKYRKIVISPGPGNPDQARNCLKVVKDLHKNSLSFIGNKYFKVTYENQNLIRAKNLINKNE